MTRPTHRLAGLIAATCAAGALTNSAFAQSNSAAEATNVLNRSSTAVAREYVPIEAATTDQSDLPANVDVSAFYRPLLESMLRRSPTFRRQCLRIANEPSLTVHLRPFPGLQPVPARAITHIVREPNGRLSAGVEFDRRDNGIELIAHEFEHVIEQLDGIDLSSKAVLPDTGVHAINAKELVFETTRARRIGLKVAQEVRTDPRRAD